MSRFVPLTAGTAGDPRLAALLAEAQKSRGRSLWRDAVRKLLANRLALASLLFLALLGLATLCAPFLPLASPLAMDLAAEPRAPVLAFGDQNWQHRVSIFFRLTEAPRSRDFLARTEATLAGLVRTATGAEARVFRTGQREEVERLELALPYRAELDPARGAELERRVREHLAGQLQDGRLHLRGGGDAGLELAGVRAVNGYWELGAFDRWLLAQRVSLFGFFELAHWLGTDSKGRDVLARVVFGGRVSLLVALAGALVSMLVGVAYGAVAGYAGGRVDELMMRAVDALYSIPFLFVVIFVITLLNGYRAELEALGVGRMTAFFAVLGLVTWLGMARVVRGQVLALKNQEFVLAARALGAGHARILLTHVLPNLLGVIAVYLTLTIPAVMLFESFLSFLGLGVEPPRVSWGLLAADALEAIQPLAVFWWLVLGPALALGTTLLALNVLGDGLRDALDPRSTARV